MRNPVVSDSEVYEMEPLIWKELSPNSFWAKKPDGNVINVYLSNGWWKATNAGCDYRSKREAIYAAEQVYRDQLRKALRRVSVSSTPRPRHKKKGE